MNRTRRFNVLLSDLEYAQMNELAELSGLSASDWFRQMVRNVHRIVKTQKAPDGTLTPSNAPDTARTRARRH